MTNPGKGISRAISFLIGQLACPAFLVSEMRWLPRTADNTLLLSTTGTQSITPRLFDNSRPA